MIFKSKLRKRTEAIRNKLLFEQIEIAQKMNLPGSSLSPAFRDMVIRTDRLRGMINLLDELLTG
jgi:hypothetical protein